MNDELFILWTDDNPMTAEMMVFMYGHNAIRKGWWDKVTIIIWGAASKLAAENEQLKKRIKEMMADGVRFVACKSCADQVGSTAGLEEVGVEVFYTGELMTDILKNNKKLLTV